jgi:2-dehydropantoate 2-reductase
MLKGPLEISLSSNQNNHHHLNLPSNKRAFTNFCNLRIPLTNALLFIKRLHARNDCFKRTANLCKPFYCIIILLSLPWTFSNQTTMKKIFILGSGAIGKALAVFLKLQQRDVVLLRGSVDNVATIDQEIEVILHDNTIAKSIIEVSSLSNYTTLNGLIVLTTKAFSNPTIAKALKGKTGESPIIVMQNGLNVEQPFVDIFPNVLRCVLFATSQTVSPTQIRFRPVAISPNGLIKGNESQLEEIVTTLSTAQFGFKGIHDIQTIIWKKVIANCVFNSICPLLNIDNGIFHRDASALAMGKLVVSECVIIAQRLGIALEVNDLLETIQMISKSSDGQLISTLQDINHGRETEIESLNFAIVKLAEEMNIAHLVTTTKLLGELTKLKAALTLSK